MTDRKTPMQRYRDVADRELLRRVAEEVMSDCWDAWCSEAGDSHADVDLDAIIDRVLADAPLSDEGDRFARIVDEREGLAAEIAQLVEALNQREADLAAAHARGVAEERERCARIAEHIWDFGQAGAHGGEQANRTAAAIRAQEVKHD